MKRLLPCLTAALLWSGSAGSAASAPQSGRFLWHSYSAYTALDSTQYYYDFSMGTRTVLSDEGFVHAMNADFGSHGYDVVFMAIDPAADEWDIWRYNAISGAYTNLTPHSGFRNEDPKFSPCGTKLVFKRGYWSAETDGFLYDLAELDLRTGIVTMLTNDANEQSMPCYTDDGRAVLYSEITPDGTGIFRLDLETMTAECLYLESGRSAYYPMTAGDRICFTSQYAADLRNDCILELSDGTPVLLPFNRESCNTSDAFPLSDGRTFYCSTADGSYDLYFYDGTESHALTSLNTAQQELAPAYFGQAQAADIIAYTTAYLVYGGDNVRNMDADGNGTVNAFDLAYLKKLMQ